MANQNYRIFPNKVELFKFFGAYAPQLNAAVSARLPLNGLCVGTQHKAFRNTVEFFTALAELSGLDVDAQHSTIRMGSYIVFFNKDIPSPNSMGKVVDAKIVEMQDKKDDKENLSIDLILEEAMSLNDEADKKGSKDRLVEFALSKGVTLTKNKSFEKMIADLKSELEAF